MRKTLFVKQQVRRLGLSILLVLTVLSAARSAEVDDEPCDGPDETCKGVRIVTPEELAEHVGKDGGAIWLSILGEVFDVSTGTDFYAPDSSYSTFSGCDATVPFVTGKFTAEEGAKSPNDLSSVELAGILDWRNFYRDHEVYKFVGLLQDPRYYDENGSPTAEMQELQVKAAAAKAEQDEKARLRKLERQKRKPKSKS